MKRFWIQQISTGQSSESSRVFLEMWEGEGVLYLPCAVGLVLRQGAEKRFQAAGILPSPSHTSVSSVTSLSGLAVGTMAASMLAWWKLWAVSCLSSTGTSASPAGKVQLCSHSYTLSFGTYRDIVSFVEEAKQYFNAGFWINEHFIHLLEDVSLPRCFPIPLTSALICIGHFFFSEKICSSF